MSMTQAIHRIGFWLFAMLAIAGDAGQGAAAEAERFEVSSIKAVRPILVDTLGAIRQGDMARAKEVFDTYDAAWNGIEVYINTRSKALYEILELDLQPKITKALEAPRPDTATLLSDAQTMLAKYDEAIDMVANGPLLNPIYDDVARLRIVRAHLREVNPALKVGNLAKARKSFEAFDDMWFDIEDFVRAQSLDAYVAIERGMLAIEEALKPEKPDVAQVTALVTAVMNPYNTVVTEVQRQARRGQ
jgi:high-affinity iron transporter